MARRLNRGRSSLVATIAALVSACSGTLPGRGPAAAPSPGRETSPGMTTRTVGEEGLALRSGGSFGGSADGGSPAPPTAAAPAASVPSASQSYTAVPPEAGGQAAAAPAPPVTPYDPRDKQLDLLTDAVTALRQEVGRSYEHSQRLTQENEKLRGVVWSLRRELAREKGASKVLKQHLESLENRMRELEPPPLEPPNEAGGAAPPPAASNASPEPGAAAGASARPGAQAAPAPAGGAAAAR